MRCGVLVGLIFLLPASLSAEDGLFKNMKATLHFTNGLDYATTLTALSLSDRYEANPIVRLYIKKPVLNQVVWLGIIVIQDKLFDSLYKKNKVLSYVLLGVMIATKGYVIYHNLKML